MVPDISLHSFTTPILFLIFSRPQTTKRVFEVIRKVKPKKLYIAADGPRAHFPGEAERCAQARKIATAVDWDCDVQTLFRDNNLGCGKAPSSAISWFFQNESEGIILEDDCLPALSFFPFCAELLARYRHDTRIMHISGSNFEKGGSVEKDWSYYFSNFICSWGWATWRRAWKFHDFTMNHYDEVYRKKYLYHHYNSIYERDFFQYVFRKTREGSFRNVWDYQWQFACRIHSGLVIVPARNLVVNLGLGKGATNTTNPKGPGCDLRLDALDFPLRHPEFVMANRKRDRMVFTGSCTTQVSRMKSKVKRIVPQPVFEKLKTPLRTFLFVEVKNSQTI
jgi:hypothetical protein